MGRAYRRQGDRWTRVLRPPVIPLLCRRPRGSRRVCYPVMATIVEPTVVEPSVKSTTPR
jgi:hypothetical protein